MVSQILQRQADGAGSAVALGGTMEPATAPVQPVTVKAATPVMRASRSGPVQDVSLGTPLPAQKQDVVIIGGGVTGAALYYLLSRYTDLSNITLLEKNDTLGSVNSSGHNNSQTLHRGDIETNYTPAKAIELQKAANMVERYATTLPNRDDIIFKCSRMVLAVGAKECAQLKERYTALKDHFPGLELFDRASIAELEPGLVTDREDEILALGVRSAYSAVDYGALSRSFVEEAPRGGVSRHVGCTVGKIERTEDGWKVKTDRGDVNARFVVVAAGGHSLLMAHQLGYGKQYACLPIAGSFYFAPQVLNGKVYTVQNPNLPFAAVHGDPDVCVDGKTRFGPTALVLPMLERHNARTIPQFFKVLGFGPRMLRAIWDLVKKADVRRFIFRNILYEIPGIRRWLFLREARKIAPSLKASDLTYAHGVGGIRPQLIDKDTGQFVFGVGKIDQGDGIIFNMTPSPGATACLSNGLTDLKSIVKQLGCSFDETSLNRDLR